MPDISKIWSVGINNVGKVFTIAKASVGKFPGGGSAPTAGGDRGVFQAGSNWTSPSIVNILDYITISTSSNASDFGDLPADFWPWGQAASLSNASDSRGLFAATSTTADIVYINITSLSNALGFGNLSVERYRMAGTSNGTGNRGVFGGGTPSGDTIDYVTISTLGNALDFGNLTGERPDLSATSNGINARAVWGGGYDGGPTNVINQRVLTTLGNATSFGNLTVSRYLVTAASNA